MYHDFSDYYDQIFPVSPQTVTFLKSVFTSHPFLLDMGCGTGGYALKLSSSHHVEAWDFDQAMIHHAQKKKSDETNPIFRQANVLDLNEIEKFDGIYCIGNTLVHLADEPQMNLLLQKIFKALKPNGVLVIQIINYDRILDQGITGLSTIRNQGYSFERTYVRKTHHIAFQTRLITPEKIFESELLLYPIRYSRLVQMMHEIGFHDIECYGDFDESIFSLETSIALIMKGRK